MTIPNKGSQESVNLFLSYQRKCGKEQEAIEIKIENWESKWKRHCIGLTKLAKFLNQGGITVEELIETKQLYAMITNFITYLMRLETDSAIKKIKAAISTLLTFIGHPEQSIHTPLITNKGQQYSVDRIRRFIRDIMTEAALGENLIVISIRAAAITKEIALRASAEEVNRWTRYSNVADIVQRYQDENNYKRIRGLINTLNQQYPKYKKESEVK
ncbi:MAG: hypothetical protein EZS28_022310 [Streblomastix strix]|uniref:Uncharacterized protein n=1 Tax=Streblomastix strix TaxID=222440 RepID=A0A5J4VHT9_9EUKA|nr:MAG: hypothetical protein EZS28_022310 [Streblomastix strix]